jgi:hypothetical protein
MIKLLRDGAGRIAPARPCANSSRAASFPSEGLHILPPQFSTFLLRRGTRSRRPTSAIFEPVQRVECSDRFHSPKTHSGDISMTITAAHIPAIVALIAGVLILIMPRLLNFVVAIYLILTGLIGLGVLRMFHM